MKTELKDLIAKWIESGRVAHHYPKLKRVALNGGRSKTESEALAYLQDFFKPAQPEAK
jgi:hypothetical protein